MTKYQTPRWGWAITGSGHFLRETTALILELEHVDLFLSKAAAEVLRMYKQELVLPRSVRVYRDTTASSVPVGQFYYGVYHTLIVAPATSNAVAKFVCGISDELVSNVFAQGGKCRVPTIVFACDTAPELVTEAPKGMVKVYPRPIDLENRERLGRFAGVATVDSIAELREALARRRAETRAMSERILFLTGHLARARLENVLQRMAPTAFDASVFDVGVKVAALMTEAILLRRLPRPINADRVIVPGRCRADLARLSQDFGVPFQSGPDELKDLPAFFGKAGATLDLSRHALRIFAEIVEASQTSVEGVVARAKTLRDAGADVIDLGCLPDTPFPHLEEAVQALKARGFAVSVDSADPEELRRGGAAGADYLLSLTEHNLAIAEETRASPVLVPARHGDLASLFRAAKEAERRGLAAILDPILDPIHFGFADSLARYREVRAELPEAEMMMGTGNLTELTDADTAGVTAILVGICSELRIANALTVQVSAHTRRTLQEHDAARRIMFAAAADRSLPKGYGRALLQIHDRAPFPNSSQEIAELAAQVKDGNFRVETAEDGIHVYSRAGHFVSEEAFALFEKLGVESDGAHAFYLGAELMKAEIAFRLGKRYAQDEPLDWGCATDRRAEDASGTSAEGHRLRAREANG